MKISVIIPVYNDAERLRLCLTALAEQTLPTDEFEVIVVDNGSDEPPRDLVEDFAFAQYAEEAKTGSYAARNHAIGIARGDVLVFTDSDCRPHADWLERLRQGLTEQQSDLATVGGHVEIMPRDPANPTAIELFDCVFGMPQEEAINLCHFAATANMATHRAVFDKAGLFNDELKSGGDIDWGQRLREHDLPVTYVARAVVDHPARWKWKQITTQARRHAGGRHDMKVGKSYRYFSLHFLRAFLRMIFPQPRNLQRIAANKHVTNPWRWLKATAVMLALQYVQIFERLRLALGGTSVRR